MKGNENSLEKVVDETKGELRTVREALPEKNGRKKSRRGNQSKSKKRKGKKDRKSNRKSKKTEKKKGRNKKRARNGKKSRRKSKSGKKGRKGSNQRKSKKKKRLNKKKKQRKLKKTRKNSKKGARKTSRNDSSTTIGCPDLQCIINAATAFKVEKDNVKNFFKQRNRIQSQLKTLGNKLKKKGTFEEDGKSLKKALGDNIENATCGTIKLA